MSWLSEHRIYVIGQEIVAVDYYAGDAAIQPDLAVVAEAVQDWHRSGEAPAAYGIDFGVLASGKTALVEANDGFALGAYKISGPVYTELLFCRWRQLLSAVAVADR